MSATKSTTKPAAKRSPNRQQRRSKKTEPKPDIEVVESGPDGNPLPPGGPTDEQPQAQNTVTIHRIVGENGKVDVGIQCSGNVTVDMIQFLCEKAIKVARKELELD